MRKKRPYPTHLKTRREPLRQLIAEHGPATWPMLAGYLLDPKDSAWSDTLYNLVRDGEVVAYGWQRRYWYAIPDTPAALEAKRLAKEAYQQRITLAGLRLED